jgi:4-hydroxybenzoate polyprenyltransferase
MLRDAISLCRPRHWVKNVFVLAPLAFAAPADPMSSAGRVALAFAVFCLLSSAVYCLNDVLDREADRRHPRKRLRPVAAGRIGVPMALGLSTVLAASSLVAAIASLPRGVALVAALYLVNNLAYTTLLKHHAIIDVISIAIGFVLRLLAGALAVPALPSSWLVVCGFSVSLLLGLGNRRADLGSVGADATVRSSLKVYTAEKLDVLLSVAASVTLLSYMLYTVSAETQAAHGTTNLVYTTPVVAYGIFRYIFKTHESSGDGPVEILAGDPVFGAVVALWLATVVLLLATA